MSISRSDVVTQFVRPLVMKEFFFSQEFQGFFKEVLRMIQGRFRAVQMKFPWCFKKVSSVLQKVFGVEVLGVC